ncbi:MAG: UPF0489 family protein [Lentisphaeria bacterium]|nr:UPF0489 family protein [Lentisphaeria bacterium]
MIPFCIVEEHHQVLPFWTETAGNGTLDFILTLDHHTDVLPAFSRLETKPEIDRMNPEKAVLQLRHDEHIDWALRAGIMNRALILSHENFTEPAHPAMMVICPELWPDTQAILNSEPSAVSAAEKVLEPEYLQYAVTGDDLKKSYILDIDLDNFLCKKALRPERPEFFLELVNHAKGISISMERDWQRILRFRGETLTSDDILSMLESLIRQKFT